MEIEMHAARIRRRRQSIVKRGLGILLIISIALVMRTTHAADDPAPENPEQTQPDTLELSRKNKSFDELYVEWESLRRDMQSNMDQFLLAKTDDERQRIRRLHDAFAESARLLNADVTAAAIREWQQRPEESAKAAQWLIEFARIAFIEREWEKASRLSDVLLEHSKSLTRTDRQIVLEYAACSHFAQNDFHNAANALRALKDYGPLPGDLPEISNSIEAYIELWEDELRHREREHTDGNLQRVHMRTSKGTIIIELFDREEPTATSGFVSLVVSGYYDGLNLRPISRESALETFAIHGDANAESETKVPVERNHSTHRSHFRGSVSMQHSDGFSDASRVAFMTSPSMRFDKQRIVFGRVVQGMEVVDELGKCNPDEAIIFEATVLGE